MERESQVVSSRFIGGIRMQIKWQRGLRFVETPFQEQIDTLDNGEVIKRPRKNGEPTVFNWRGKRIEGPSSILETGVSVNMDVREDNKFDITVNTNQADHQKQII